MSAQFSEAAGAYVSFPFCRQKCTFCNFASGVFSNELRAAYLAGLNAEIRESSPRPDTLYLGGGTPSLLTAGELDALLANIDRRNLREATIEAAPGDVTAETAATWRSLGIDRVSLGVQSFDEREARAAGRKHSAEDVAREIALLRRAGIGRINVDLIAGLAHQTEASWRRSLDWVERLEVEHVSIYMLEADDDSRLGAELRGGGSRYGASSVPSDEQIADCYEFAVERLAAIGVERYEISNFARPGAESLHNLKYWTMGPYLGFGADAHSFDGERRWSNARTAAEYVAARRERGGARGPVETIDAERRLQDLLLTGLRRAAGVRLPAEAPPALLARADDLIARGWLERPAPDLLRLTSAGVLYSNSAIAELIFPE